MHSIENGQGSIQSPSTTNGASAFNSLMATPTMSRSPTTTHDEVWDEYSEYRQAEDPAHPSGRDASGGFPPGLRAHSFGSRRSTGRLAPDHERVAEGAARRQPGDGASALTSVQQFAGVLAQRAACSRSLGRGKGPQDAG